MDLQEFRKDILETSKANAAADGTGSSAAYAGAVAQYLVDAEVLPDFVPAFYSGEGWHNRRLRVDGYALDDFDNTMNLMVVRYDGMDDKWTLTRTDAEQVFEWAIRFLDETYHHDLHKRLEISTPTADLVDILRENRHRIRKFRLLLLTDGVMSDLISTLPAKELDGVQIERQIWDVARLHKVCLADLGRESIEVDFTQYSPRGLPCLETAQGGDVPHRCFMSVIPGTVLADVYDRYGAQLMEGNVRSFLSTKVAVNKKIRETILTEPAMFFIFNNGISVTATDVIIQSGLEGTFLTHAKDFQIINGGQTTASLSHARHERKADLSSIFVQMKLTEIKADPEATHGLVEKIARSSNSQNKVSDADFFSTHPFHVRMQQISRRLFAPAVGGAQYETRWFYERARGQYLQEQMKMTPSQRKRFAVQNPKGQLMTKTDMAKVLNSWHGNPHTVSKGAQSNFTEFADWISEQWTLSSETFNERFFQDAVALFILFKHTERLVSHQPWYQQGYRANIVTYSIALLAHLVRKQYPKRFLDLQRIWGRQEVPESLNKPLAIITRAVMESITNSERATVNVTQWCKREACWSRVKELPLKLVIDESLLVDEADVKAEKRVASREQVVISGIEAQTEVVTRQSGYWQELQNFVRTRTVKISPEERAALGIACQLPSRLPNSLQCQRLLALAKRAEAEGFMADR